jgi:hypothetical protein
VGGAALGKLSLEGEGAELDNLCKLTSIHAASYFVPMPCQTEFEKEDGSG